MDWNLCIICQENRAEPLKCPDKTGPYHTFLANVKEFQAIYSLPTPINFGPNEYAASFIMHNASWHKSCHLKYNSKLNS